MTDLSTDAQRALLALYRETEWTWVEEDAPEKGRAAVLLHPAGKAARRLWAGSMRTINDLWTRDYLSHRQGQVGLSEVGVMAARRLRTKSSQPFGAQHRTEAMRVLVRPDQDEGDTAVKQAMTVNIGGSAPGWLLARGHISQEEYEAGERFREDFDLAGMQPKLSAGVALIPLGGAKRTGGNMPIKRMDAYNRWKKASEALGAELADIAIDACCLCKGVERIERERSFKARSVRPKLEAALTRLAKHYRGEL